MTDPRTRRPEYWRNVGWATAIGALVILVVGICIVVTGGRTGWLDIVLGVIVGSQSILNFRQYLRAKRERDDE